MTEAISRAGHALDHEVFNDAVCRAKSMDKQWGFGLTLQVLIFRQGSGLTKSAAFITVTFLPCCQRTEIFRGLRAIPGTVYRREEAAQLKVKQLQRAPAVDTNLRHNLSK